MAEQPSGATMAAPAAQISGGSVSNWRCVEDPNSGKIYWYDEVTGITTWDDPTGGKVTAPEPRQQAMTTSWAVATDPGTGRHYWYDLNNPAVTTWTDPNVVPMVHGVSPEAQQQVLQGQQATMPTLAHQSIPVGAMGVGVLQAVAYQAQPEVRRWKGSRFDCFDDVGVAFIACLCPCIIVGQVQLARLPLLTVPDDTCAGCACCAAARVLSS